MSMRAVGLTEFGGPEVLRVVRLAEPHAGPGQVRIRVRAATVNPADTLLRNGAQAALLSEVTPPYVPGLEAAGEVDEVGEGVTDLAIGDAVMAFVASRGAGAYAEHVVVSRGAVAHAPMTATAAEAATVPMNALTARRALDVLQLVPGQTLAVTGAAGAVGGFAVQLARAEGLDVIADAGPEDVALLEKLGATTVLPRGLDFPAQVRRVTGTGVGGLLDAAVLDDLVAPALADAGRVATVRRFAGTGERGISYLPVSVGDYALERAKLERLSRQVDDGALTPRVARVLPAEQAPEAHRLLEQGGIRGRLVLEL